MRVFAYTHTFILYISLFIGIIAVVKAIKKGCRQKLPTPFFNGTFI